MLHYKCSYSSTFWNDYILLLGLQSTNKRDIYVITGTVPGTKKYAHYA